MVVRAIEGRIEAWHRGTVQAANLADLRIAVRNILGESGTC